MPTITLPQNLIEACQNKNLIPVVGAGVSMSLVNNEGEKVFPSWTELLQRAAEELKESGNVPIANAVEAMLGVGDLKQAAKYARQGLQGVTFGNFFKKNFDEPLDDISDASKVLPEAIWGLGNRVLTLNYDKVMRGACPDALTLEELVNKNPGGLADFKRGNNSVPMIWHFHGRVGDISTLIFTAESYDEMYSQSNSIYQAALDVFKGLCRDQQLLFVGCSLEDAELLYEMRQQHQLYDAHTGPHYALVHHDQHDAIKQKIKGLPIELLTFESFGDPLVRLVKEITSQSKTTKVVDQPQITIPEALVANRVHKIALLSANPLNDEQCYTDELKAFKKIGCRIDHYSLSVDNLNNLEGYDLLLILTKVIRDKVLIENEYLCGSRISFQNLEEQIWDEPTNGVIILSDQLPDSAVFSDLNYPTLCIAESDKNKLGRIVFKLFKKAIFDFPENTLVANKANFSLVSMEGGLGFYENKTTLPSDIDPKTLRSFIGRAEDLEQICRKILDLESEGGILTIKGSGGIGKTTTVKKIVVALAARGRFNGGISFVDCEAISDYRQFKYNVGSSFNLEQAEHLEQHLREHHDKKSRLIILDNFETLLHLVDRYDIKDFLNSICNYASVVVTSRERLQIEGETVYEMRQFITDEAEQLFLLGLEQRQIRDDERNFLRQEILENQLDNNPLAIKLITANMPKGKNLESLKEELEIDLFSKIIDSELSVFDSESDINIARKKSIYGSILYSYRHLRDDEQHAFELLSLFPDGIDLENFKHLTRNQEKSKNSIGQEKLMITDRVIKALENKSMIENSSGHIKLQSIVGKFAEAQLCKRDDLDRYYHNAFVLNHMLMTAIIKYELVNKNKSLSLFNAQQGNFLKCISFLDKIDIDKSSLCSFLEDLNNSFTSIATLKGYIEALSANYGIFNESERLMVDVMLLSARYFDGDFTHVFAELKQIVSLCDIARLNRGVRIERLTASYALNIYMMEGDALYSAEYSARNNVSQHGYSLDLMCLGEYNTALARACKQGFDGFEVLANMRILSLSEIEIYREALHEKRHLERMQVSYVLSKMRLLHRRQVEVLVTVNPYTNGLKKLMLAFVEENSVEADKLYNGAIEQLLHIKYYYVEALYFYVVFLQKQDKKEFDGRYCEGLDLAKKHHYRFLQYRFEQLLEPTDVAYDSRNYPLPDDQDFSDYIQFLIKENK